MTGFPFGLLAVALTLVLVIMLYGILQYDWEDEPEQPPEELDRRVSALETAVFDSDETDRVELVTFVKRAERGEYGEDSSVDEAAELVRNVLEIQNADPDDMEGDR